LNKTNNRGLSRIEKESNHSSASVDATILETNGEVIMQFGKSSPGRYSLDFRFPLSPVQAFAVALSTFFGERRSRLKASSFDYVLEDTSFVSTLSESLNINEYCDNNEPLSSPKNINRNVTSVNAKK
jgi:hypothetical protein